MSAIYETSARAVGGREGHAETPDGLLKVDLALPPRRIPDPTAVTYDELNAPDLAAEEEEEEDIPTVTIDKATAQSDGRGRRRRKRKKKGTSTLLVAVSVFLLIFGLGLLLILFMVLGGLLIMML